MASNAATPPTPPNKKPLHSLQSLKAINTQGHLKQHGSQCSMQPPPTPPDKQTFQQPAQTIQLLKAINTHSHLKQHGCQPGSTNLHTTQNCNFNNPGTGVC
jgi:hypothetical protein